MLIGDGRLTVDQLLGFAGSSCGNERSSNAGEFSISAFVGIFLCEKWRWRPVGHRPCLELIAFSGSWFNISGFFSFVDEDILRGHDGVKKNLVVSVSRRVT